MAAKVTDSGTVGTTATTLFQSTRTGGSNGSAPLAMVVACDSASAVELLVNVAGLHGAESATPAVPIAAGTEREFILRTGIDLITGKGNGGTATYTMYPTAQ